MIIVRSPQAAAKRADLKNTGSVVTIGNFDGVHLGHQAMLRAAKSAAEVRSLPLVVLSFDPHPEAYFSGLEAPARLGSLGERAMALQALGVDILCVMPFNQRLAQMPHHAFEDEILCTQFNTQCLVIGDDFHYGQDRQGNSRTLRDCATRAGFEIIALDSVLDADKRVSSTQVRHALAKGDLSTAAQLLGRPYEIMGRVTQGDQRGRTWGFPTLNLPMRHQRALKGVFAVSVKGLDDKEINGVANLGKRPTVGGLKTLLEVHLFNFTDEVYGHRICVTFHTQIRHEQKFDSFDDLKLQIGQDIVQAKQHFAETET